MKMEIANFLPSNTLMACWDLLELKYESLPRAMLAIIYLNVWDAVDPGFSDEHRYIYLLIVPTTAIENALPHRCATVMWHIDTEYLDYRTIRLWQVVLRDEPRWAKVFSEKYLNRLVTDLWNEHTVISAAKARANKADFILPGPRQVFINCNFSSDCATAEVFFKELGER